MLLVVLVLALLVLVVLLLPLLLLLVLFLAVICRRRCFALSCAVDCDGCIGGGIALYID